MPVPARSAAHTLVRAVLSPSPFLLMMTLMSLFFCRLTTTSAAAALAADQGSAAPAPLVAVADTTTTTNTTTSKAHPLTATAACKCANNCSNHGTCGLTLFGAACTCDSHWTGADCSACLVSADQHFGWMGPQCADACPQCRLPGVVATSLPSGLLSRTLARFPENKVVNPKYVNWTNPNLHFLTEGRMNVTFLYDGAGYHNGFGYYTFNPVTLEVLSRTVLFPDATTDGSKCLQPGDSVQQLGPFPAGTHVGFFIQSDGWCNAARQSSTYTLHSIEALNADGLRHLALYQDVESGVLVLGFEDIYGLTGDNDYNDVMFFARISGSVANLTVPAVQTDPCRAVTCPRANQRCEAVYTTVGGSGGSSGNALGVVAACVTDTATATPTPTATRSRSPTATATATARARLPTVSATLTPSSTPTGSRTPTATSTATGRARTVTRSGTQTQTRTRTATPSRSATVTRTPTAEATPSPTASRSRTQSRTRTATRPSRSRTATPTGLVTRTLTSPTTRTRTPTPAATSTPTPPATPVRTPTTTASRTATRTRTATREPTATPTATGDATETATQPPTVTPTQTQPATPTPTRTATVTGTGTGDATATADQTLTRTRSPTRTATAPATLTPTSTPEPGCASSYTRARLASAAVLTLRFGQPPVAISFTATAGTLLQVDPSLAVGTAVALAGPFAAVLPVPMTVRIDVLWEVNQTLSQTAARLDLRSATVLCVASPTGAYCQPGKRYSLQATSAAVIERTGALSAGFALWDDQTTTTTSNTTGTTTSSSTNAWTYPLSDRTVANTTERCRNPDIPLEVWATAAQCERQNQAGGCPVCMAGWLTQTQVSDPFLRRVFNTFPERQDVNSSFISWANPNLHFLTEGSMNVTFLHEGAAYHNQMGYFVYDPLTLAILTEVVLFTDASLEPNCLERGAAALNVGPFPAGTHVGFFIVSDGWCPPAPAADNTNRAAIPPRRLYSVDQLNTDGYRHLAVYHDLPTDSYVLGFEDVWGITDDRDYNDVMFTATISGTIAGLDVVPAAVGTASLSVPAASDATAPGQGVCCGDLGSGQLASRDYGCCGAELLKTCSPFASCARKASGVANCTCLPGYQGNGTVCADVDECATGAAQCHRMARCTNTAGGYQCQCQAGFKGDGRASCLPNSNCTTAVAGGRRQMGGDLRNAPAPSPADCEALCLADAECVAATFSLSHGRCWMHSVLLGTVAVDGDWSYVTKDCGSCTMSVSGSTEQSGAVLAYHSGTTRSACAAACLGTAGCVAATHDATLAGAGDCFLHYALMPPVYSEGKSLLTRVCPSDGSSSAGGSGGSGGSGSSSATPSDCTAVQYPGRRQTGADLSSASAATPDECAGLCLAYTGGAAAAAAPSSAAACVAASFVTGQCWMHSQLLSTSADSSWTYIARQCGGCGFVRGEGLRLVGNDLANHPSTSVADCESRCTGAVGCAAVTFSGQLQRCWLHSGLPVAPVSDAAFHLSVKRCASGCTPQYFPSTRMAGSDLSSGPASTAADCARLCQSTKGCAAASFNAVTQTCWMHANLTAVVAGAPDSGDWVLVTLECGGAAVVSSSSGTNANATATAPTVMVITVVLRVEGDKAPLVAGIVGPLANFTGIPTQQIAVSYTLEVTNATSAAALRLLPSRFAAAEGAGKAFDVGVNITGLDGVNATAVQTKLKLGLSAGDALTAAGVRSIASVQAAFTTTTTTTTPAAPDGAPSTNTGPVVVVVRKGGSGAVGKVVIALVVVASALLVVALLGFARWYRQRAHVAHILKRRRQSAAIASQLPSGSDKEGAEDGGAVELAMQQQQQQQQDNMHLDGIKVVDDAELSEEDCADRRGNNKRGGGGGGSRSGGGSGASLGSRLSQIIAHNALPLPSPVGGNSASIGPQSFTVPNRGAGGSLLQVPPSLQQTASGGKAGSGKTPFPSVRGPNAV